MHFAAGGICRYVISSGGSFVKETSWASSARVLMWKEPVLLLITIGMMSMSPFQVSSGHGLRWLA